MNRLKLRHTGLDRRRRVWRQAMLAALGLLWLTLASAVRPARAQAACGHVDFLVEGGAALDRAAICEAAQPWADDGIRLFVYLTDVDPGSEDAWFAQLDEVESAMGYRAGEIFDRSLLALEATSGSSASWAVTFTYGEALYDTPLDQDETAVTRLKNDMRQALQSGDATAAFVTGVSEGYSLNHPGASPLLIGAGVVAGLGVLGAGGYAAYRSVLLPAQRRRQRREELQAQLARLQERVANLLLALEQLIAGQQPEEATLFQVFEAYGGRHEPEMETAVRARIAASQQAFDAAFALRQQLLEEDFQQAQSLEEQVRAWELLYLSLVGSDPRIRGLTEAELRDLLDPVVVLQREAQGSAVVAQLRDLSKQIQGMPLKVDMLLLEPDNVDQAGILGTLEEVETAIGDLMAAQAAAPERLDAARAARLSAEEEAASATPFGMTPGTIFPGIDARIQTAADDITAGAHVRALRAAETILRDLEVVEDLIDAAAEHAARQAEVDAVLAEGYRPATLAADREELATDVAEIRAALQAGDYLAADDWIDELDADSQRLLAQTTTWRETHLFNQESIERIRERQAAVLALLEQEAAPAWQALQQYAAGNWEDVAPDLAAQRAALQALTAETLPAIAQLNSLETQQFPEAERQLAAAGGRLLQTERALQAVGARLAAVRTAEETMPTALPQTQAELDRATALRDAEDAKIGPEVDAQLHQAAVQLAVAREAAEKQQWLAAATAQAEARRLALAAHTAADAQVQRV
ncbi:MAG: hypothetical protein KC425_02205, partial [Anaerolineales bacterium]|nr:hypothetical protein [Anaerolineales bacterium]